MRTARMSIRYWDIINGGHNEPQRTSEDIIESIKAQFN